jgi:hypothetical protein
MIKSREISLPVRVESEYVSVLQRSRILPPGWRKTKMRVGVYVYVGAVCKYSIIDSAVTLGAPIATSYGICSTCEEAQQITVKKRSR